MTTRSISNNESQTEFQEGLRDGIPIALGYFAVSFSFGIMGSLDGLSIWQTTLISMTNVTSAGQFAGLTIMANLGSLIEMALTQLIINLRYSLMSISLTQKVDKAFKGIWRMLFAFFVTDEIFAVAIGRKKAVSRIYFFGLLTLPYWGWALGTLFGAVLGDVLPAIIVTSLGIALYGMFIAIVTPVARDEKNVRIVVFIAILISCAVHYLPYLNHISSGFAIIISAVIASAAGAILFPITDTEGEVEA
jgi:predicted branched-subunit amino acid permease